MPSSIQRFVSAIVLTAIAFAIIATAILSQPRKWLNDFDQSFYLTIAHDLDRYGVFSNGIFDRTDSTVTAPPPGMFFVPGYPLLVLAAMKVDARFAKAVECSVAANHDKVDGSKCDLYVTPILIIHAFLLALAALAIALCGQLIFGGERMLWLAGLLATAGFAFEAEIFSFVMTESLTVFLYSLLMLFAVSAWIKSNPVHFGLSGLALGLLCLTRPSFMILVPVLLVLILVSGRALLRSATRHGLIFAICFSAVLGPWIVRNHVSVGKWGLTEEYGSAVLIERFAYNDMTVREFALAFPYCTPGIGDLAFDQAYGRDSMHRFVYHTRDSFFHVGRGRRDMLVAEHGRLDPIIGGIVRAEMRDNWWRHLLVSIPLGWCGMWIGWLWGLLVIPLFAFAVLLTLRRREPMLLLYATPAIVMLGVHAVLANHYTRYNLILIGPLAVGAAAMIYARLTSARWRARVPAPES